MAETLKEKTAKGLFWGLLNSGTTQVLNLVIGVFLARLLTPSDYGVVGMLAIFTAIAGNLQSSGFSNALINIKEASHQDYNAVFWFNISMSMGLYVVLFFAAPWIALFFNIPALTTLSRFLFLTFVVGAFGIVPNVILTKRLMMKEMAIASNVSLVVSGIVGIVLALMGMTYWSLAWQQLTYITITNVCRYYYCDWRPTLKIDFTPIKKMFSFSVKILITSILNTINNNLLTFVFGKLFTTKEVGNFSQGYKWSTMAYALVNTGMQQMAQPILASLTQDAVDREQRVFRKMFRFTAMMAFPCLFGLALIANEFIITLLGNQWSNAIVMLQILCISGAFMPLYTLFQNLAISHHRSDIYMWCNFFQIALQLINILVWHRYGITVMVAAYSCLNIVWLSVWFASTKHLIGLRFKHFMTDMLPFFAIATVVMLAAYGASVPIQHKVGAMMVKIFLAIVLYTAAIRVFYKSVYHEVLNFFFKRKQ